MNKTKYVPFKYRGQKFRFAKNELDFIPGFRVKRNGIVLVSIYKGLSERKKSLELHRLIAGRGLRNMSFRGVKNTRLSMQG